MHDRRKRSRILAAVTCLVFLAATAPSAVGGAASAATTTGPAIGVVSDLTWGISRVDMERTVTMMGDAGVRWARMNVGWSAVERDGKGRIDAGWLAELDAAVASARAAGIQVLMPIADGVPYWASADPKKYEDGTGQHWNELWRPSNPQDYADFVRWVVTRYKAQGVHTYEVWNEPNHPYFWPSGPNASEYVSLLAAAYPAIKQADPTATVLLGGLSGNDSTYMDAIYAAGGKPYFDVAAVHPYTGDVDPTWCWTDANGRKAEDAFCGIEAVRATMVANGDAGKGMWLTEFGWSTTTGEYGVSEARQAEYLGKALDELAAYPYVTAAFWYNFRNTYWLNDAPGNYEANAGMVRTDFTPKPAYDVLRQRATIAPVTTFAPIPNSDLVPLPPTNLTARSLSRKKIAVSWMASSTADNYKIQRSADGRTWVDVAQVSSTTNKYVNSGLRPATTYQYRMRASNNAGSSLFSTVVTVTTPR